MTHEEFDDFLELHIAQCRKLLDRKSSDYSSDSDKLYNFKKAASIEGTTAIEALWGMDLKHRTSLAQGIEEIKKDKLRPWPWWQEKITDHINYMFLLLALIKEADEAQGIVHKALKSVLPSCGTCQHDMFTGQPCAECAANPGYSKWEPRDASESETKASAPQDNA